MTRLFNKTRPSFAAVAVCGLLAAFLGGAEAPLPAAPPKPLQGMIAQRHDAGIGDVARFYQLRGYEPAWTSPDVRALVLLAEQHAAEDGLDPTDYAPDSLQRYPSAAEGDAVLRYDIAFSATLFHFEHDLRSGRVPPIAAGRDIGLLPEAFDSAAETHAALSQKRLPQLLAQLKPPHGPYALLRQALARLLATATQGGWPLVPDVRKIEFDATDPNIAALRARLAADDPAVAAATDDPKFERLKAALQHFQAANGLMPDGVAGHETIALLNVPVADRIATVIANMERWRWMPRDLGSRYIMVNVANASLDVVDNGKIVLTSRLIVGKRSTPTPLYAASVVAVTVNPYWNVPAAIARHEILPKGPGYLASHNMVMVDGQVRQMPGSRNSLGYLKLEMPNPFSTYLHDTPARSLFARDQRFLSHGCMRVQQIQPLASYALTGDVAAGLEDIGARIATGANQTIALPAPLPVYVVYWTAIPAADGTVGYRDDVYGRDRSLLAAILRQHLVDKVTLNCGGTTRAG